MSIYSFYGRQAANVNVEVELGPSHAGQIVLKFGNSQLVFDQKTSLLISSLVAVAHERIQAIEKQAEALRLRRERQLEARERAKLRKTKGFIPLPRKAEVPPTDFEALSRLAAKSTTKKGKK